ncbi:MAG: hypothetical protein HFH64_09620, partial [Lachnospiraceae bacterium]|nr:hypothetical protein [Lachnospiraceae bacterium]
CDLWFLVNSIIPQTVRRFLFLATKKCRIYAACGVSQTPIQEIIKRRLDILGYVDVVDKKYAGYCVALDLNVEYSPRLKLYALANGNTIPVKVEKKIFADNPIKRGDIVKVEAQYRKQKIKKVNDEWIETNEKEWWISKYKIY